MKKSNIFKCFVPHKIFLLLVFEEKKMCIFKAHESYLHKYLSTFAAAAVIVVVKQQTH